MANIPIEGMPSGAPLQLTDVAVITRSVAGTYTNYKGTLQQVATAITPAILPGFVTVLASQDIQLNARNALYGTASRILTLPAITTPPQSIGSAASVSSVRTPEGVGHIIQAQPSGVMFFDGIPYTSIQPKTFDLADNRTFNLSFWLVSYAGEGYWVGNIDMPFTGDLNGTPLLGTIQWPGEEPQLWALDGEGNLTKDGQVMLTAGSFNTPEEM